MAGDVVREQVTPNRDELAKELKEEQQALIRRGGEIIDTSLVHEKTENLAVPYYGAGMHGFTKAEQDALRKPFDLEVHDILPDGLIYVAHVHYRNRLLDVFGIGDWGLVPVGEIKFTGTTIGRQYQLIIRGKFAAEAMGEADWSPSNTRVSKFTATESCQSAALVRCCKGLGMGLECWDRRWTEDFKKNYCERFEGKWRVKPDAFKK